MRTIKRNIAFATAGVLALGLGLSACGDDDNADAATSGGGPKTADIRVWLNGTDTPQEARDWLKQTFEDEHPGSTLTIEQQEWEGLVEKLTTSLSSDSETPDVVEVGNTQAPTFTTAGAFSDLTDQLPELGGDDLTNLVVGELTPRSPRRGCGVGLRRCRGGRPPCPYTGPSPAACRESGPTSRRCAWRLPPAAGRSAAGRSK